MLYLGADHRGFKLKESLKKFLAKKKIIFIDLGNSHLNSSDDYTDIGYLTAKKVAENPDRHRAVLICGSGIGICIAANKVSGIRAGIAYSPKIAQKGKEDDNMNILCLAADATSSAQAMKIISAWLKAKFKKKSRYVRRINEIEEIERAKFKPNIS
ncbi:MAG: RpiB/LacA/LacB family sugar-phosphate isomerase [Patescibacteria group bacterium]